MRESHVIECRLLASAAQSHNAFATLVAAGVNETVFDAATRITVWGALADHYTRSTTPLPLDALRLKLGRWADSVTEVECSQPYEADDLPVVATQLLDQRSKRSLDTLRKQLQQAIGRGDDATARRLFEQIEEISAQLGTNVVPLRRSVEQLIFRPTEDIFEPLPDPNWVVRGLHIGPGRPTEVVGVGYTGKSLLIQELGLAVATGLPVWHYFESRRGVVRHIDHEQGFSATARRYQRLALGRGIDPGDIGGRLTLCSLPRMNLASEGAFDAYSRAAEGADLVLVDSLRAATPGVDENSSEIREHVDMLLHVSERTGAAVVFIHHGGKASVGKDADGADKRAMGRGSIAIFDGCGCVLNIEVGRTTTDPKRVHQAKTPADAVGAPLDDFEVVIEDVRVGDNPTAGVRVVRKAIAAADPDAKANAQVEADIARVLNAVRKNPGASQAKIVLQAGIQKRRAVDILTSLVEDGRVAMLKGAHGAMNYRPVEES